MTFKLDEDQKLPEETQNLNSRSTLEEVKTSIDNFTKKYNELRDVSSTDNLIELNNACNLAIECASKLPREDYVNQQKAFNELYKAFHPKAGRDNQSKYLFPELNLSHMPDMHKECLKMIDDKIFNLFLVFLGNAIEKQEFNQANKFIENICEVFGNGIEKTLYSLKILEHISKYKGRLLPHEPQNFDESAHKFLTSWPITTFVDRQKDKLYYDGNAVVHYKKSKEVLHEFKKLSKDCESVINTIQNGIYAEFKNIVKSMDINLDTFSHNTRNMLSFDFNNMHFFSSYPERLTTRIENFKGFAQIDQEGIIDRLKKIVDLSEKFNKHGFVKRYVRYLLSTCERIYQEKKLESEFNKPIEGPMASILGIQYHAPAKRTRPQLNISEIVNTNNASLKEKLNIFEFAVRQNLNQKLSAIFASASGDVVSRLTGGARFISLFKNAANAVPAPIGIPLKIGSVAMETGALTNKLYQMRNISSAFIDPEAISIFSENLANTLTNADKIKDDINNINVQKGIQEYARDITKLIVDVMKGKNFEEYKNMEHLVVDLRSIACNQFKPNFKTYNTDSFLEFSTDVLHGRPEYHKQPLGLLRSQVTIGGR